MTETARSVLSRPSIREYLAVGAIIAAGASANIVATSGTAYPADIRELLLPMLAMFALTAAVWLLMVIFRNGAVLLGAIPMTYFRDYKAAMLEQWIERPARAFDNLMQVPTLFYVAALLMIVFLRVDSTQVTLAWIFVASRAIHAIIYIGFNYVPFRFATYTIGCITLATMWAQLALTL